jgi:D-alanyl-D-alanine carboxypeptidase
LGVVLRRAPAFALTFVVLSGLFTAPASARTDRHAALVLDVNSGAILHKEDADELRHPASLTKMMTLYLTFETLESGRLKMSDKITISKAAASVAPSKLDLDPGEQISVSDAIYAVVTKSANDIAVALAEKIGGTETNFVRLMNTRARELGMTKTHFENPSGLPNDAHVSTARDMATLALHLMDDYPNYYPLFATHVFKYRGKSYRNHNTMLNTFAGVDGIKTGYTRASGFNLVTSVHRGKRHLIGVVFGGSSAASRNAEMRVLLTRALARASTVKTRKPMLLARLKAEPRVASRPASRRQRSSDVAAAAPAPRPFAQTKSRPSEVATAESSETPIHVFKVRHVPIVTNARPDETTDMDDSDRSSEDSPTPNRGTAERSDLGRFAVATRQPPAADRREMLGAADTITDAATPAASARPVAFAPASLGAMGMPQPAGQPAAQTNHIERGLPPSTLNAQAWALRPASNAQPEPVRPQARQSTSVTATAGNYEVQIGAYGSIGEAQRALNSVQDRAHRLLAGITSVTHPTMKDGHQIYRARFAGFNAERATSTCTELRRKGVDCFVMAGE